MKLPTFSYDMIDYLEKQYPEKCPDIQDTERSIWMYAGKRDLVRTLVALKKRDERNQFKEDNKTNKEVV